MLRGGSLGLSRSYCRLRTPNGSTNAFWYMTAQLEHSYRRTRRSSLKGSRISSTLAQTDSTSRIGFCLNINLTSWQILQENTKNTGYWQYRQPERRHAFAQDRLTRINKAKLVHDGDGHLINKNECWYQYGTCSESHSDLNISRVKHKPGRREPSPRSQLQRCFASLACGVWRLQFG